ncbi:phenylacetate-CoA oxygenase subunit PaaJ [Pusillimonas sp. TS35]|uniref:1,2-phenylacetyl-CoA epoxidase subunit PaaD n=1 Tax=Paracandidimonas lactea TaxID=2895524 RepID=UPI0013692293|nr:1,2-phenylacetyl-CoA epoxidase subunit PaaD [Paracandidimonas lactea]MYN11877.1 phenylacetate-CoA oxygenase subunit PaaJ [Pusillimonas sp. TS35]
MVNSVQGSRRVDTRAPSSGGATPHAGHDQGTTHPSRDQVLGWLEAVPDPEIPVISIVDLGIVRDVHWDAEGACVVTITPTYSGCPAMQAIAEDIAGVLRGHGITGARIETRLAPAWTTDWMSGRGREALRGYGIAPPQQKAVDVSGIARRPAAIVPCPHCGAARTRLISDFGATSCKALYRCNACGEPFDYFKTH